MHPLLSSATAAFHEEALETLNQIEAWLLTSLESATSEDAHWQDTLRLLHSLKGTAASFENEAIAKVCHAIENILTENRQLTSHDRDGLLTAIDFCRQCLSGADADPALQDEELANCLAGINRLDKPKQNNGKPPIVPEMNGSVWQIDFAPQPQFFENGHDPLRIIKTLRQFGPVKVSVFTDKLPDFADFDLYKCYLRWQITLTAEVSYQQIISQFDWVKHVSDVTVEVLALPQTRRVNEPNRYKMSEANLQALLTVSHTLQTQLKQTFALTNQLNQTDKIRLTRRNQAMKHQQQLLQQQLLHISMRPLADAFARLPRMAFDLANKTDKPIQLNMDIAPIEVDSMIVNSLMDPLTHLLRNTLAHGIEPTELRQQSGKPVKGQIHIIAEQIDEQLIIRFSDDGAGLSEEKILAKAKQLGVNLQGSKLDQQLLSDWVFRPGFSTAVTADAISGRGIGLDVVKQHITDMGGRIELISSNGRGCCFTLYIPVHQALMDVQLIHVDQQTLALPLISVLDSYAADSSRLVWHRGKKWFITDDNRQVPLIDIRQFLQLPVRETDEQSGFIVLLTTENNVFAMKVDSLAEQAQLLVKSLLPHYRHVNGIKGVAILNEGNIALLIEPGKLLMSLTISGEQ